MIFKPLSSQNLQTVNKVNWDWSEKKAIKYSHNIRTSSLRRIMIDPMNIDNDNDQQHLSCVTPFHTRLMRNDFSPIIKYPIHFEEEEEEEVTHIATSTIEPSDDNNVNNNNNNENQQSATSRLKDIMLGSIRWYREYLSPIMPPNCRFQPSCSVYAIDAITQYGPIRGGVLTAWRIFRCNPFGGSGYDPPSWPPVNYFTSR